MDTANENKYLLEIDYHVSEFVESKFDIEELLDLEMYGHYLTYLEQGKAKAITKDELDFLEVLKGECEPKRKFELLWIKYRGYRRQKIPCKKCTGKGYYISPRSGNRHTCELCHGAGFPGASTETIYPDGTY